MAEHMKERWPDFYVVGAPKAGTTSIYNYLSQHPKIFVPEIKEPDYFSFPEVRDTYYNVHIVADPEEYVNLYSEARSGQISGDFSPSYLFSAQSARRIAEKNPGAKILIVLRDPVERAISHYLMDVNSGLNTMSLMESISEKNKINSLFYREYVEGGRYDEQIARFKQYFPDSQIKVLQFENLKRDVQGFMNEIISFLGIGEKFDFDTSIKHLRHTHYKSSMVKRLVHSSGYGKLRSLIPSAWRGILKVKLVDQRKPIFTEERVKLTSLFSDYTKY